jgi:hypothetical protein
MVFRHPVPDYETASAMHYDVDTARLGRETLVSPSRLHRLADIVECNGVVHGNVVAEPHMLDLGCYAVVDEPVPEAPEGCVRIAPAMDNNQHSARPRLRVQSSREDGGAEAFGQSRDCGYVADFDSRIEPSLL